MTTAAIIDLGSNSNRMGIYQKTEIGIRILEEHRFSVRLSEGLAKENLLQENAMQRTLASFLEFKKVISNYPDATVKCVATEAMRRAKNAAMFQNMVLKETGIQIEIIGGEAETRYGAWAARQSAGTDTFYMLDTGGGSFELALCENGELKAHICLPYGAVVLTETFEPDKNGTEPLSKFMNQTLSSYTWVAQNGYPIVLLGGSNRVIGKLHRGTDSDQRLDGMQISVSEVLKIIQTVIETPPKLRENLVGMEKNRIDIITAGLAPLRALIEKVQSEALIICTKSIRDGIAAELLK